MVMAVVILTILGPMLAGKFVTAVVSEVSSLLS